MENKKLFHARIRLQQNCRQPVIRKKRIWKRSSFSQALTFLQRKQDGERIWIPAEGFLIDSVFQNQLLGLGLFKNDSLCVDFSEYRRQSEAIQWNEFMAMGIVEKDSLIVEHTDKGVRSTSHEPGIVIFWGDQLELGNTKNDTLYPRAGEQKRKFARSDLVFVPIIGGCRYGSQIDGNRFVALFTQNRDTLLFLNIGYTDYPCYENAKEWLMLYLIHTQYRLFSEELLSNYFTKERYMFLINDYLSVLAAGLLME